MDEAVSGGGAEVSQRAGEASSETVQAEERLLLGGQRPLNTYPVRPLRRFVTSLVWVSSCEQTCIGGGGSVCVVYLNLYFYFCAPVSCLHISASP